MATPIVHQATYILHTRPYGDTSIIADCFTRDFGRVAVYARGARAKKKSQFRTLINPFVPSLISAIGNGALKTLTSLEAVGPARTISGRALYCGFYLNELLVRLLPEGESQPEVFNYYKNILEEFSCYKESDGDAGLEVLLRTFEWLLVQQVGAAFSLTETADTGQMILPQDYYRPVTGQGLVSVANTVVGGVPGSSILRFSRGDLSDAETRMDIKRFMRIVLRPLLGSRPLKSQELFR